MERLTKRTKELRCVLILSLSYCHSFWRLDESLCGSFPVSNDLIVPEVARVVTITGVDPMVLREYSSVLHLSVCRYWHFRIPVAPSNRITHNPSSCTVFEKSSEALRRSALIKACWVTGSVSFSYLIWKEMYRCLLVPFTLPHLSLLQVRASR